jgi:hypothetical protein
MGSSTLDDLVAHALDDEKDTARWGAVADFLSESGDPLGEVIALGMRGPLNQPWDRLQELERAWLERFAPWAQSISWVTFLRPCYLKVSISDGEAVFAHAAELCRVRVPVTYEIYRPYHSEILFAVDHDGGLVARVDCSATNEGTGSYGPSFEDEWHYYRKVTIYRVRDRAVVHEGPDERDRSWVSVWFAKDGLYARNNDGGRERLWSR